MSFPNLDKATLGYVIELAKNKNILAGAAAALLISLIPRFNSWLTRRKVNNYLTDSGWDWAKEIVVVTGGSSGIGKEIVLKLAKKHIKVIIVDLNAPSYQLPPSLSFCSADLSDPVAISKVAKHIVSEHGDPTVLINNAGIGNAMSILACPESKIRKVFDVNMIAPILLVKHFLPAMIRRNHGHVVNVGSLASFATQASNVDYGCTKSGLLAFHEGLLQELRHIYKAPLVRASIIHPTWVKTPLIADLIAKGKMKDTTISAESVADSVVNQLYTGYGAQVVVPNSSAWTSMIRGIPGWIQEGLRDKVSVGLLNAMDS
ncbi:Short-chain dehydrogenase/reductase SDR [Fusarium oxysporum f. sp. vasinfectum]|nr:Short-chain dehydrogenase/reductase SDR [Fusarium oxysporum f. sp. vasinfectum]